MTQVVKRLGITFDAHTNAGVQPLIKRIGVAEQQVAAIAKWRKKMHRVIGKVLWNTQKGKGRSSISMWKIQVLQNA